MQVALLDKWASDSVWGTGESGRDAWGRSQFNRYLLAVSVKISTSPLDTADSTAEAVWSDYPAHLDPPVEIAWSDYPAHLDPPVEIAWSDYPALLDLGQTVRWIDYPALLDLEKSIRWIDYPAVLDLALETRWIDYPAVLDWDHAVAWNEGVSNDREVGISTILQGGRDLWGGADLWRNGDLWQQNAPSFGPLDAGFTVKWGEGEAFDFAYVIPWGHYTPLDVVVEVVDGDFSEGRYDCRVRWASDAGDFGVRVRWLKRIVFMLLDRIFLTRVYDGASIPILSGECSIDIGSWAWSVSIQPATRAAVRMIRPNAIPEVPGRVEVELEVNGFFWRFLINRVSEGYAYGQAQYGAAGIALAHELGPPKARRITKTWGLTSTHQIVGDLLFDTNWSAVWATDRGWDTASDIVIPANVFSVENATPIEAVCDVATAIGGVVQADPVQRILNIHPAFPERPLDWVYGNAAVNVLAQAQRRYDSAFVETSGVNTLYISGKSGGVGRFVMRTGTDPNPENGEIVRGEDIVHPLMVSAQAVQLRGERVLDENGFNWEETGLEIPLGISQGLPGLCKPPNVIDVSDIFGYWTGQVTACSIRFSDGGVVQNLSVRRLADG